MKWPFIIIIIALGIIGAVYFYGDKQTVEFGVDENTESWVDARINDSDKPNKINRDGEFKVSWSSYKTKRCIAGMVNLESQKEIELGMGINNSNILKAQEIINLLELSQGKYIFTVKCHADDSKADITDMVEFYFN